MFYGCIIIIIDIKDLIDNQLKANETIRKKWKL